MLESQRLDAYLKIRNTTCNYDQWHRRDYAGGTSLKFKVFKEYSMKS